MTGYIEYIRIYICRGTTTKMSQGDGLSVSELSLDHENTNVPLLPRHRVSGRLIVNPGSGCARKIGRNTNIGPGSFTSHEHSLLAIGSGSSPHARPSNEGVLLLI